MDRNSMTSILSLMSAERNSRTNILSLLSADRNSMTNILSFLSADRNSMTNILSLLSADGPLCLLVKKQKIHRLVHAPPTVNFALYTVSVSATSLQVSFGTSFCVIFEGQCQTCTFLCQRCMFL